MLGPSYHQVSYKAMEKVQCNLSLAVPSPMTFVCITFLEHVVSFLKHLTPIPTWEPYVSTTTRRTEKPQYNSSSTASSSATFV